MNFSPSLKSKRISGFSYNEGAGTNSYRIQYKATSSLENSECAHFVQIFLEMIVFLSPYVLIKFK